MELILPSRDEVTADDVKDQLKKAGIPYTRFTFKRGITQPSGVTLYHIHVEDAR